MPISLDSSYLYHFRNPQKRWWATSKTDGVRCLLVAVSLPAGRQQTYDLCCLLDRKMQMYLVPGLELPRGMFQGTVLDGELLPAGVYVPFDAVCVNGVAARHLPLSARLRAIDRCLTHAPARGVLTFRRKTYVAAADARDIVVDGEADGLLFIQEDRPVVYGRDFEFFKLKSHHTVDFLVGVNSRDLLVFNNGKHKKVATARESLPPGSIVELEIDAQGSPVGPPLCRHDKHHANDLLTYQKTTLNAAERLTVDDVLRALAEGTAPASS